MAKVWDLDPVENMFYFQDVVLPAIDDDREFRGRRKGSRMDQVSVVAAHMREQGGDATLSTLAERLGVDSIEDLARILGGDDEEEEEVEDTNSDDLPPLFLAVLTGLDWNKVLRLVGEGEDVNQTINWGGIAGLSLITVAAEHATVEIVRALVKAGANVNQMIGNPKHEAGYNTPLVTSLKDGGRMDIFNYLLEAGADPDHRPPFDSGATALHRAAMGDHPVAIHLLLEAGADPEARDLEFHSTPLGWAKYMRRSKALEALS